ncbi:MAG TPA: DUF488 domain-containing protein [Actinomycetota bacterium]|nr:DUF488 domain-containing protein [Actinomycetota bacterium]
MTGSHDAGAPRLFTVGHGTRTTEQLVAVLDDAGVGRVVDVRRYPGSRRHPHFARSALERSLSRHGMAYVWCGEELGGRRSNDAGTSRHRALRVEAFRAFADHMDTDVFRTAVDRLVSAARRSAPSALMCAETLWWRCHRRLISDALVLRGVRVDHLLQVGRSQPHHLHEAARADGEGRPVYDVGQPASLDLG